MSAPRSSKCVAKLCRKVCGLVRGSRPARATQTVGRVGFELTLATQETTPGTYRRHAPSNGGLGVALVVQPGEMGPQQPRRELNGRRLVTGQLGAEELDGLDQVLAV